MQPPFPSDDTDYLLVFHLALIVFAALQVHETKTALVTETGCDGNDNYIVRLLSDDGSGELTP